MRVLGSAFLGALVSIAWFSASIAMAQIATAPPAITRPVTDETGVLSSAAIAAIEARLRSHREAGHAQIALLFVRSTNGEPITDYANRVATAWGGGTARADDGVLFVLALDDHEMRIEVGYGLEASLTDANAMRILDELVTPLREGRFDAAAWVVSDALIAGTGGASQPLPDALAVGPVEPIPSGDVASGAPVGDLFGSDAAARRQQHQLEEERAERRYLLVAVAIFVVPTLLVFLFLWRGSNTSYGADGVARTNWSGALPIVLGLGVVLTGGLVLVAWFGLVGLMVAGFIGFFVFLAREVGRGGGRGGSSGRSSGSGRSHRRDRPARSHHSHGSSSFGGGGGGGGRSYGGGGGGFGGGGASKRW